MAHLEHSQDHWEPVFRQQSRENRERQSPGLARQDRIVAVPEPMRPDLEEGEEDLLSSPMIWRAAMAATFLALVSITITLSADRIAAWLDVMDFSASTTPRLVTVGLDTLAIEENAIRFERQRQDGPAARIDLALTWPGLQGFREADRMRFADPAQASGLIFVQITQSVMSRDMSGRMEPIYSQLFEGDAQSAPFGLTAHRFRKGTGYDGELIYSARRPANADYAVRCIDPAAAATLTADCQRDLHMGRDLTILYRFSSKHLASWKAIDTAIRDYITHRLASTGPAKA
ncbi:hypothetical protein ACQ3G6_10185 [Allorhizobium undicola]|uniref:hypothetical protein n=1 Tax=Allorhizobium undicola TaxID=78527 RepID=UPI003D353313